MPKIPVLDKPLAQGGTIQYITPEEYQQRFGCTYHTGINVPAHLKQTMKNYVPPANYFYDNEQLVPKVKAILEHPREDIAIINLGKPVGHGLMALKKIKQGEILCVYSGEVLTVDQLKMEDDYVYHYSKSKLCVSSRTQGGLARFFPHLPIDHDRKYPKYLALYKDINKLSKLMAEQQPMFNADQWKTLIKNRGMENLGVEQMVKQSIMIDAQKDKEFEQIIFTPEIFKKQVATCNVDIIIVKVDELCYITILAGYDIEPGEILGMSYQENYWNNIGCYPKLLLKYGTILDQEYYYRTQADFKIPLSTGRFMLSLSKQQCLDDLDNNKPLELVISNNHSERFSLYQFRDRAANAATVSARYGHLDNSSFALALQQKFKNDAAVKTYFTKPEGNAEVLDNYTAEIVVTAKDKITYEKLLKFFTPIEKRIIKIDETLEIVIKDSNINDCDDQHDPNQNLNIFFKNLNP